MSGVFWEADKQPNLCEAASGFTMSTVNLAVAIPMAVVDLVVMIIMTIAGVCNIVLGPIIAQAGVVMAMVLEMLGLESISTFNAIVTGFIGSFFLLDYLQTRGKVNGCQKLFSRWSFQAQALMLGYGFLNIATDNCVYPRLAQLSLAIQIANMGVDALFKEYNNFCFEKQSNVIDGMVTGFKKIMELETAVCMLVAVFGLPSFSDQDDVTVYYSVIPFIAMHLIYFAQVKPAAATEDSVDHVNGDATAIKEAPADTSADVAAVEKPNEDANATTDEAVPEADKTADGSSVETIAEQKTESMIKRLQGCVTGIVSKVCSLISPLTNMISKMTSLISSLPWSCITLVSTVNISYLLVSLAWFTLTSNILATTLPVFSMVVPLILSKVDMIPAQYRPYLNELNILALSSVQLCLITGVTIFSADS